MIKLSSSNFICLICVLLISGCASQPVNLHNIVTEVFNNEEHEWYVVEEVRHGDVFRVKASFIWPGGPTGRHKYRWEVRQDGQVIRPGQESNFEWTTPPAWISLSLDSSLYKQGDCEVILYIDGNEFVRHTVKIMRMSQ